MSAVMDVDGRFHHDRGDVWTLEQARVILGENYEEFARDLAAGAVPSTLAVLTPDSIRPVAVTAGAIADWLHGRLPAAVAPAPLTPGQLLACVRSDVAKWAEQDRLDAGVAADLEHYLQRIQDVVEALEDRLDEVNR